MGLAIEGVRELRVHPRGKRVAFTVGWPHLELWVIENFLPDSEGP